MQTSRSKTKRSDHNAHRSHFWPFWGNSWLSLGQSENGEYFFGIPKDNKIEVYLLTSAEDLYEYLAEESEGFCLIGTMVHS